MSEGVASATLVGPLEEHEALHDVVSDRTLAILEQRRVAKPHRRGWLVRRLLVGADVTGLLIAFFLAQAATVGTTQGRFGLAAESALFVVTLPGWVLTGRLYGLYGLDEQRTNHVTTDEFANVFNMVTVCTWLFFAFTWVSGAAYPSVPKLLLFWTFAALAVPLCRTAARAFARSRASFVQNTIIVGAGSVGQTVAEKLLRHPEYGVNVVGFVDTPTKERDSFIGGLPLLGSVDRLSSLIDAFDVERVIIAFPRGSHERILSLIRSVKDAFVQVDVVPRYFELTGPNIGLSAVEGVPVLCLPPRGLGSLSRLLKRTMDICVSAAALVVLSPVLVCVAALIKLDSRGPVFFRQARIGEGGREFRMLKFRTMVQGADQRKLDVAHLNKHRDGDPRMFKIPDDPRTTRIGHFLRRTSIDELPQLLNVLAGQMSLVGPRPLIPTEDEFVEDWGRDRLNLRPGMTGLWQVLGRSEIPFEEMVRLDYLYVTNWSLWHDLRLMCGTVPALLRSGRGAY